MYLLFIGSSSPGAKNSSYKSLAIKYKLCAHINGHLPPGTLSDFPGFAYSNPTCKKLSNNDFLKIQNLINNWSVPIRLNVRPFLHKEMRSMMDRTFRIIIVNKSKCK